MGRTSAIGFVFFTALLDAIGFGIIAPVMPQLIMDVTAGDLTAAARYGGALMMVYAVMQFFFAPVMGNLSDRFGRRPVLLVSLSVLCIDYVIMSWAPTLGWLFAGRLIAGVSASTFSTCNAFISDITPPDKRAQSFGIMGAAFGLGFVIGPVLGGLLGEIGPRVPFLGAAGLTAFNLLYGLLVLPETLAPEHRRPFRLRRANPLGTLTVLRRYPRVLGLVVAYFLFMLGHHVLPSTWAYFTIEKFAWSERDVGYSLGFVGLLMTFVQAVLLRWTLPKFGPRRTAYQGFGFATASFIGYACATQGWMLYAFLVPGALAGLVTPSMRGLMSSKVPPDAQGELHGGLASVMSLTSILAPPLMTQIFGLFTASSGPVYFPGAPYVAAAALTVASFAVFRTTATETKTAQPAAAA